MTSSLHEFFTGSDFSSYVCALFDVSETKPPQRAIAIQLSTTVYWQVLETLISVVGQQRREETVVFNVEQMSGIGSGTPK